MLDNNKSCPDEVEISFEQSSLSILPDHIEMINEALSPDISLRDIQSPVVSGNQEELAIGGQDSKGRKRG